MGGKGGGGSSNNMSMFMQQQASQEARQKEEQRAQRLREGEAAINALYDPQPVMATRKVKARIDPNALPSGFAKKQMVQPVEDQKPEDIVGYTQEDTGISRPVTRAQRDAAGGNAAAGVATGGHGTMSEGIFDAAGNFVPANTEVEYDETYDTGQRKDRFQDLYDRYETGQRDYYMPELAKQHGEARKKAYLAHAGAGTLWSSMRGDTEADLAGQEKLNKGQIESQIQDSLGGLRRQIASDKSQLINQLYATENPEMAANEALARTRTISQQSPALSPMGDLFKIAAIGLGSGFGAANDPFRRVTNQGVGTTSSSFANRNA